MKVYLNEFIHPDAVELLRSQAEIVTNFDHIEELDGILSRGTAVTAEMMERATNLKVIGRHGVGYNKVDIEAAKRLGIRVVYTPQANAASVAELVVSLALNCARKIPLAVRKTLNNEVTRIASPEFTGIELHGRVLGLVGMGNIAQRVAAIMRSAFQMTVIGYDPFVSKERAEALGFRKVDTLEEMLAQADVVSVHVHLNDSTRGMIAETQLACMKPTGIIINTSRGGIIKESALYDALANHKIFAAACDVFEKEPHYEECPLLQLDNFVGTPHLGGCTEEALYRVGVTVVEEIMAVLNGQEPRFAVV